MWQSMSQKCDDPKEGEMWSLIGCIYWLAPLTQELESNELGSAPGAVKQSTGQAVNEIKCKNSLVYGRRRKFNEMEMLGQISYDQHTQLSVTETYPL